MIMSRKETKLQICSEFEEGKVHAMSQIDFFFLLNNQIELRCNKVKVNILIYITNKTCLSIWIKKVCISILLSHFAFYSFYLELFSESHYLKST